MSAATGRSTSGLCPRAVLAVFGGLFLMALLSVPVTTSTSQLRQDPGSNVVFKTTYPRNSRMFLPSYLAKRGRSTEKSEIHLRSTQWTVTMALVVILGIFDYGVFCGLFRRSRRGKSETGSGSDPEDPGVSPRSSGLSLFP